VSVDVSAGPLDVCLYPENNIFRYLANTNFIALMRKYTWIIKVIYYRQLN
jgi:hypothetical protein